MTLRVFFWHYLWIAPHVLLLGVLAALWHRKMLRDFPLFFAYLIAQLAEFLILYPMALMPSVSAHTYLLYYSITLAGSTALRFGIIHEIFGHTFRNYPSVAALGKPVYRWGTAVLLLTGLLAAAFAGASDPQRILSVMWVLGRAASMLQCGLLLILLLFSSYLGLSLRNQVFGIALGLGTFATADLVGFAIRSQFGSAGSGTVVDYITSSAYHLCVLIWLAYLWLPERSPQFTVKPVPEHDLESWNKELQRLIQQ